MTQSSEYPDLKWMPPASWSNANRTSVQLIVIHDTEGSEHATSAEDGAAYDQRRTDGTSTHYFHDTDSTVQCVRTEDVAYAARHEGNLRGIQHELCGKAGQGKAGWADAGSQSELRIAARQCARDARKWNIPVRHLTVAQVAAGEKGFCGHADITKAFPQDNGTHTDPGPDFPWSQFLDLVRDELEDDVALTPDELGDIATAVWSKPISSDWLDVQNRTAGDWLKYADACRRDVQAIGKSLSAAIAALAASDNVDEVALANALAPALHALILADGPLTGLTGDEVEQRFRNVLTHGTEGP